jgi:hypothetical protein
MVAVVEFLDPRGEPETIPEQYDLSLNIETTHTIGLVANGFPGSVRFLDHIEKALAQEIPSASFVRYDKGDASAVLSPSMLENIQAECQAIVAAYGH